MATITTLPIEVEINSPVNITSEITTNLTLEAAIHNGARGKSTYEIWLEEGHTGSQNDFLNWLKSDGYIFTQGTPSSSWTITHMLGKYPSVTIIDSADRVVIGEIQYIDSNTLIVSFAAGFSGKAYLN